MKINGFMNWDFERAESDGRPGEDWSKTAYAYQRANLSDTAQAHNGLHSASLECNPGDSYDYVSVGTSDFADDIYVTLAMTFAFWFYADESNTNVQSYVYVYLENSTGYDFNVYYVLNWANWNPSNGTYGTYSYLYFDVSQIPVQGQWKEVAREIYQDIEEVLPIVDPQTRVHTIQFQLSSNAPSETGLCRVYYDDVWLLNSTSPNYVQSPGFESSPSSYWYTNNENHDRGYLSLSDMHTEGEHSGNITAFCLSNDTYSRAEMYVRRYNLEDMWPATADLTAVLEFDWYLELSDLSSDENQHARVEVTYENQTTYTNYDVYYVLASGSGGLLGTNTSTRAYLRAPGFNQTESWHHASLNLYDVLAELDWGNMSIYDIRLVVESHSKENARISVLFDAVDLNVYPTADPGFEIGLSDDVSVDFWQEAPSGNPLVNKTLDAHTGTYAANLSSEVDTYVSLSRDMYLPITYSLTTDFYWRLDLFEADGSNYAYSYLNLQLDNNLDIYYYICASDTIDDSWNSSTSLYYKVETFNSVSPTWRHLTRNVYQDAEGLVVQPEYIEEIRMVSRAYDDARVSVLYDDMHFVVDQTPPTVSHESGPVAPNYLKSPTVTATADDSFAGIGEVLVHYNAGSGWESVSMTDEGANYAGSIPAQPYATSVDYFIEAIDNEGNSEVDENGGAYYSYTVIDDIGPVISFDDPIWYGPASGNLLVNVSAEDPGSGIDSLLLYIDSLLAANLTSGPYQYVWDTREMLNEEHNVTLAARDTAGNEVSEEITVTTNNDLSGPEIASVILFPDDPVYSRETVVTAVVIESTGLKNVSLHYSVDGGDWIVMTMEQIPNSLRFTATIPEQAFGIEVSYYVEAFDDFGQGTETQEESFYVGDPDVPTISVSGPPIEEVLSGVVNFTIFGGDEGSGLASIEVFVDGVSVGFSTDSPYIFAWDTITVEDGEHTVRFEVRDEADNVVYSELSYIVNNPAGLQGLSDALSDIMASYGFFIGAATVIVIFLVAKLIGRRRRK
jgi:hypothetical protein